MKKDFKPSGYNSVSPYFIVDGALKFMDLLQRIFDVKDLRRYDNKDGKIVHAEVKLGDSVIMLADANEKYPPVPQVVHVYVPNVDETFIRAIEAGCEVIGEPKEQEGDPDRRGTFKDLFGNIWSVATQMRE